MKFQLLALSVILTFAAISCSQKTEPEIMPYQKKALIYAEGEDYAKANRAINSIADKYEGFVKNSSLHYDESGFADAEFDVETPYENFYDAVQAFHDELGDDLLESEISDEEALSRLYKSTNDKIDEKKARLADLRKSYDRANDVDDKIVMKYEIDRLQSDLEKLESKRLSYLESLNYSTIRVVWSQKRPDEIEPDTTVLAETAIPGIPASEIREIILRRYGQVEEFEIGEPVKILFTDLDPDKTDIISTVDFNNNTIKLKVVRWGESRETVKLAHKCQIVNIGLGTIPKILPSAEVALEQIIVTPRVDENCFLVGYEIRAGSIESGCSVGRKNLGALSDCLRSGVVKIGDFNGAGGSMRGDFRSRGGEYRLRKNFDWFYDLPD